MSQQPMRGHLTLEQIERDDWGEPSSAPTELVRRVLSLRRKPIDSFEAEDLRILLGQNISPEILVPIALERLESEPFLEGDYYPGDVLVSVLRIPSDYWMANPDQLARIRRIIDSIVDWGDDYIKDTVERFRRSAT